MDGPTGYHTKSSNSGRERQIVIPYDITYIWNLKYNANEHTYETETHRQEKTDLVAKGEEEWGGKDWNFGISRCKLSYVGWITSKVLL